MTLQIRNNTKHCFSFFYENICFIRGSMLEVADDIFVHRLVIVLRYQAGDECILFDKKIYRRAVVKEITKKSITFTLEVPVAVKALEPEIVVALPMLKKEALEEAVHDATVAGATIIQLIITEKCYRSILSPSDLIRLHKIIIAAAEQSHYYSFPELRMPLDYRTLLEHYKEYRFICADPEGESIQSVRGQKIVAIIGPEGGLTTEELNFFKKQSAAFVGLTPTILRSQEAVLVMVASLRLK